MEREYIKVPKYYNIIGITVVVVGFIAAIIHWNYIARDYKAVDPEAEIQPVLIDQQGRWGSLRASVFYKKNHFIPSAILVAADCDESILEKFNIKKSTLENSNHMPHEYLSLLSLPYELSKKKYSDTIVVNKEGCVLKFLMVKYDDPYK